MTGLQQCCGCYCYNHQKVPCLVQAPGVCTSASLLPDDGECGTNLLATILSGVDCRPGESDRLYVERDTQR